MTPARWVTLPFRLAVGITLAACVVVAALAYAGAGIAAQWVRGERDDADSSN